MLILYYCNGSVFIYVYNYIQYILRGRERERERGYMYKYSEQLLYLCIDITQAWTLQSETGPRAEYG